MNPSENPNSTPPALPNAAVETSVSAVPARRRLLRAGLMGAPALLALKSTPVLACNCKLPSGFSASGNLSRSGSKNCPSPAPKPSAWRTLAYQTKMGTSPSYYYVYKNTSLKATAKVGSTEAGAIFKTNGGFSVKYFAAGDSFDTVLARGDTDIVALTAAAYLESFTSGGANFPSPLTVQQMWNNGVVGGAYTATTGVVWDETKVKNYLLFVTGQVPV